MAEDKRAELIQYLTSLKFNLEHGKRVGDMLHKLVVPEVENLNSWPELYVPPATYTIRKPDNVDERLWPVIQEGWINYLKEKSVPNRKIELNAYDLLNPHTDIMFVAEIGQLTAGSWKMQCLSIDGAHLPLFMFHWQGGSNFLPKTYEFSTETMDGLAMILNGLYGEPVSDEAKAKREWAQHEEAEKTKEIMALTFMKNDPVGFWNNFRQMYVVPDRLMQDNELQKWYQMAHEIEGQKVEVGARGYWSNELVEGRVGLGLGQYIAHYWLQNGLWRGDPSAITFPLTVERASKRNGSKLAGYVMCEVLFEPNKATALMTHSSYELMMYNTRTGM